MNLALGIQQKEKNKMIQEKKGLNLLKLVVDKIK